MNVPKGVSAARKPRVYSVPATLLKLDARTREARLMRETRAGLLAHVGRSPSAVQVILIDRAVLLSLRVAMMDRRTANSGCEMSERDATHYLAWVNSLSRLMGQLGLQGVTPCAPTLADAIAEHAASKAAAA